MNREQLIREMLRDFIYTYDTEIYDIKEKIRDASLYDEYEIEATYIEFDKDEVLQKMLTYFRSLGYEVEHYTKKLDSSVWIKISWK